MSDTRPSGAAIGFTAFAAIMLLVIGVFQAIAGISAIAKDDSLIFANTGDKTYWLHLNTAGWGWIHLILGIVIFLAGLGVLLLVLGGLASESAQISAAMTQALNDSLEALVRQHVDQWLWIHRRWKT